jgi:S-adenosylmethionine uptake transporter
MLSRLNATQKGILIAIAGFAAFVVSDSSCKWLAGHYSVLQVVAWIYTFALLFCLIGASFLGGLTKTLKTPKLKFHIARGLSNFGLAVSVVYAFQNLPLTSVYPILFLSPFMMTVLAGYFFKEPVAVKDWSVIALGFSGVLIAFRPGFEILDPWLFVAFLSAIFISAFGLFARPLGQNETLMSLAFYPCLANVILLSPFLFQGLPSLPHLLIFICSAFMLCFGMICIAYAYRIARYAIISPLQYLQLVMAFAVGYAVFNEHPDLWMIAGSLVIVTSGILLAFTHKKN